MSRSVMGVTRGHASCALAMTLVGSSVVASSVVNDFPIFAGQALRYLAAVILLYALLRLRKEQWVRPRVRDVILLALVSLTGLVLFNTLMITATRAADPSLVGSVLGATPIVLGLVGAAMERRRPTLRAVMAALAVLLGVIVIEGSTRATWVGLVLSLGVLACEGCFSLLAVPVLRRMGAVQLSLITCCMAVPMYAVIAVADTALGGGPLIRTPTAPEVWGLVWMAVMVTAVAFVAWYGGLRELGPGRAGPFAGLIPVAALVISVILGREPLTIGAVIGCLLVGAAIWFSARRPRRAPERVRSGAGGSAQPETVDPS